MHTSAFRTTVIAGVVSACLIAAAARAGTPPSQSRLSADQRKKIEKVKKEIRNFPQASNAIAESSFEQGQFLEEKGLLDDALVQYKQAASLRPAFSDMVHYNMAMVYYKQGLLEQAADELSVVLVLNPSYAYAHYRLGLIAIELDDYPSAVSALEQVLQINPDLSEAYYYLGLAHERNGGGAERAVGYYAQYLDAAPAGENAAAARKAIMQLNGKLSEPVPSREEIVRDDEVADRGRIGTVREEEIPDESLVEDEIRAGMRGGQPGAVAAGETARGRSAEKEEAASSPGEQDEPRTYTVRENETLWIIAGHPDVYDNDTLWTYLYEANKDILNKKKKLREGMVLKIPRLDPALLAKKPIAPPAGEAKKKPRKQQLQQKTAAQAPVADEAPKTVEPKELPAQHTIAEGETLWIIAGYAEYYNDDTRWPAIFDANKDILKGKKIHLPAGTVITIPKLSAAQAAATKKAAGTVKKPAHDRPSVPAAPQAASAAQPLPNPISLLSAAVPNPTNIIGAASNAVSLWIDAVGATVSTPQMKEPQRSKDSPGLPKKITPPAVAAASPAPATAAAAQKPAAQTTAAAVLETPKETATRQDKTAPPPAPAAAAQKPVRQQPATVLPEKKATPAASALAAKPKEGSKTKKKRSRKHTKKKAQVKDASSGTRAQTKQSVAAPAAKQPEAVKTAAAAGATAQRTAAPKKQPVQQGGFELPFIGFLFAKKETQAPAQKIADPKIAPAASKPGRQNTKEIVLKEISYKKAEPKGAAGR